MTTEDIIALVFDEIEVEDAPDFTRLLREKAERQQASARTVSNVMGAAIAVATDGRTISLKGTVS